MTDAQRLPPPGKPPAEHMVWIPGGTFLMGSNDHYPEEAPAHTVSVGAFWIEQYVVTNADFRRFVDGTGYVTLAERPVDPADYPGAKPELLEPSAVVFRKTAGNEIGRVAAIAAIRTFLTFFLDRDIELEYRRAGASDAKRA